jgi:hypothetical protein
MLGEFEVPLMPAQEAIEQWREANRVAREAEHQLSDAWATYFNGRGPVPTDSMAQQAKRLRSAANRALKAAMVATGALKPDGSQ